MAATRQQVKVFMSQREAGKTQAAAAAKAGISERTGRRIEREGFKPEPKTRRWRTRNDPFAAVWDEVAEQLGSHPELQALTLLEWLQDTYPGQYPDKLLRTLQRRIKDWRARYGPDKEVMFPQIRAPGRQGLSDFTKLKGTVITIRGVVLEHLLYHFRLAFSGWCHVRVVQGGESFTALAEGLTEALQRLGGVPAEHRTDSLSAAYRNLDRDTRNDITERYEALCRHYGMDASRNNRGRGHENGSIESPHGHLKRRIRQHLALRGSADFDSVADYQTFLNSVTARICRRNAERIRAERGQLRSLPFTPGVAYTEAVVRVTSSSTFTLRRVVYSVPARLIGERLRVHLYDDRLVLHLGGQALLTLTRLRPGPDGARVRSIDYRHVIGWLVRKPRALAGLSFREELLPDANWRAIFQRLRDELMSAQACKRVVGALKLAADQDHAGPIGQWWLDALNKGHSPTLIELQDRFRKPGQSPVVALNVAQHKLADYDSLLKVACHG
jgi:DNA-binding XRE family transcriptional regulator